MRNWARAGAGIVLGALVVGCAGTAVPSTAGPTRDAAPSASPSPPPTAGTATAHPTPSFSPLASESTAPSGARPSTSAAQASPTRPARASAKPGPSVDPAAIAAYLTATITLLDLADTDLAVGVTYVDPASGQTAHLGTYSLAASERLSNSVPPSTYRLDLRQSGVSTGSRCTIAIKDGDAYTFVAVPGAIAITRAGFTPSSARDLFVATSSLCTR